MEAVVCLRAAPRVQLLAGAGDGQPQILRYHFRDCKALLDATLTYLNSAIS